MAKFADKNSSKSDVVISRLHPPWLKMVKEIAGYIGYIAGYVAGSNIIHQDVYTALLITKAQIKHKYRYR